MNKEALLADLAPRVTRIISVDLQDKDTKKVDAGIRPYLASFMFSRNGQSIGENVLFYVYDEGQPEEKAEYDSRSFNRLFGGQVYQGDLSDVRIRAIELIGSADPSQAQSAFDVMVNEQTLETKTDNRESELSIMSRLGITKAETILGKIEAYLNSQGLTRVIRMIQSERGINLADNETKTLLAGLQAGGVLTESEVNDLLASNVEQYQTWPNLQLWQVKEALQA